MSQPNGKNGSQVLIIAIAAITIVIIGGVVAIAIYGEVPDPTALLVIALAAVAPTLAALVAIAVGKDAAVKAEQAAAKASQAVSASQKVASEVVKLGVGIDGKMEKLISTAEEAASTKATLIATVIATDKATEIAERSHAAILEATITPLPHAQEGGDAKPTD